MGCETCGRSSARCATKFVHLRKPDAAKQSTRTYCNQGPWPEHSVKIEDADKVTCESCKRHIGNRGRYKI